MKLLFIFLLFGFTLACSSSSVDSAGNGGTEEPAPAGEESTIGDNNESSTIGSDPNLASSEGGDKQATPPTVKRTGPCANYPLSCGDDVKVCEQKYLNCLLPKAGDPVATAQALCKKDEAPALTLLVNKWDSPAGKNNLLCDFWENTPQEELLYLFATNQQTACQNEMDRRKAELIKEGYQCE